MGGRIGMFVAASAIVLAACGQGPDQAPTAPDFVGKPAGGCSFTTVSDLTKNEFGANSQEASWAISMKNAGAGTNDATYLGYRILGSIEPLYPALTGSSTNAAQLTVALLTCMNVGGTPPSATTFEMALSDTGAYGVRGLGGIGGVTADERALYSHKGSWLIEPPATSNWQAITTTNTSDLADSVKHAVLVYGNPVASTGFTNDALQSSVFKWSTIPTATFDPGVIVGECTVDANYLQHNSSGSSAEVLGFVNPGCRGGPITMAEPAPRSLAERIVRFFEPAPLAAATLITGTGGSKTSLSPFGVIFPGQTKLVPGSGFKWNKSYFVNQPFSPTVNYGLTSAKGTKFLQPYILVWLEATNNQGNKVAMCNNWAYSKDGQVSFPAAYLNKAGGYTITTRTAGAFTLTIDGTSVFIPTVPPSPALTSPLINVKNSTGSPTMGCDTFTDYTVDDQGVAHLNDINNPPPYPGLNGQ